jgi:hypothetical protein
LESPSRPGLRRILPSVLILAAIFVLSLEGLRPPAPKPINVPAAQFSASRALETLRRVLGNDVPHPVGGTAHDAVRDRIVAELTALGYQPQIQDGFACSDFGECGTVNNILARLDGSQNTAGATGAVLLAAHYDSVPAGPGDSDDGTGVAAVLESARALKARPAARHSIIFLIDDGEEAGLLGARVFVDSHPWAKEVRAAVNVDARGTSGPSLMFETGTANDWAVQLYARSAVRPSTSSIFYSAYKALPNDTDFTVFKAAGYQGLNFAFIGDETHYHTPLDNSANVNHASLQDQGENALAAVTALANSDLSLPPGEAVFFDLFGRLTIHWRARRSLTFAILALLLLLLETAWVIYQKRLALRAVLWGLSGWLATILATGVCAVVLRLLIRAAGGAPVNWIAHPLPMEIAFWSLAAAVVVVMAAYFFSPGAGFWGLWSGIWIGWGMLAVVFAWLVPGLSYVALVPAGIAALAGLPAIAGRSGSMGWAGVAAALPLGAAAILGFAPAILLYDGLGNRGLPLVALLVGLILTPVAPLCDDLHGVIGLRGVAFAWVPIATTVLGAFVAAAVPAYSAKAPERVNIEYWRDADTGQARWIVWPDSGRLPEPIRLATTFRRDGKDSVPWEGGATFIADAPSADLSPPTFTILDSGQAAGRRTYRALLRSERGAPFAAVLFPAYSEVADVEIEGHPIAPESPRMRRYLNGWSAFRCAAIPAAGVEIDFSLPIGKPVEVWAADRTYELPPDGAFLLKARPLTAAPSQDGDTTMVTRRVQLIP